MASLCLDPHIEQRYQILRHVGSGAYGVVWCAYDKYTSTHVALKKVFDAFGNKQDAQRTYREVMLLRGLHDNPHIVRLLNVMCADNDLDLYLVFELAETDLTVVLRKQLLVDVQRRYIAYQLVKTVAQLHARGVLHRDLKPANVFVYSDCSIKLGDFGLARTIDGCCRSNNNSNNNNNKKSSSSDNDDDAYFANMTDYIATRWYRAPENLAKSTVYTTAMDMWALGCVIAELLLARPLFAGKSTAHQLALIVAAVGEPSKADVDSLRAPEAWALMDALNGDVASESLQARLADCDADAVDLVRQLVVFSPARRLTARQALQHAYLAAFVTDSDLASLERCTPLSLPLSDRRQLVAEDYKGALYDLVAKARMHHYSSACVTH